jgi:hypothetical protein
MKVNDAATVSALVQAESNTAQADGRSVVAILIQTIRALVDVRCWGSEKCLGHFAQLRTLRTRYLLSLMARLDTRHRSLF